MAKIFRKPATTDALDYKFDFKALTHLEPDAESDYLESGETVIAHTITVETGITLDSSSITDTNTSVTVWLSGGLFNEKYTVTCQITTSAGRTETFEAIVIIGPPV